jgi:hypothetical protein
MIMQVFEVTRIRHLKGQDAFNYQQLRIIQDRLQMQRDYPVLAQRVEEIEEYMREYTCVFVLPNDHASLKLPVPTETITADATVKL